MNTWIMLLRGINVGGNNILRMQDLRQLLEGLDLENVRTYIQSGNVVFQGDGRNRQALAQEISAAILESHDFAPEILLFDLSDWLQAISANPYPQASSNPKSLHLYFLAETAQNPDFAKLDSLKSESEQYRLIDEVFYLYAPEGIGRSKMANSVEKALGVRATARNWRTVSKINEMIGG